MKPISGKLYRVHGSSLDIYIVKVQYQCEEYSKVILEFVAKDKEWRVWHKMKNVKLYHDRITHWKIVH